MNRLFSIRRRRPNYVDLWGPKIAGADQYRLKWASTFSGASTMIIETTNVGFLDPNVNRAYVESQPTNGGVRMVFDPASYGISDQGSFWLQLVPVTGGVEGTPGAMTLVLPAFVRNNSLVTILGTPVGTQQLDLPVLRDVRFENSASLNVALEEGGAIFTVPDSPGPYPVGGGQVSTIFVSGGAFAMSGILSR